MRKKCLYLLLAGALVQMPVIVRADTPDERIQKLERDLENAKKEIQKLKEERDRMVKDQEKREKLLWELILDPELRKKMPLPPKSPEQRQSEKAKNELEKLQEERDRLARDKEERDKRIEKLVQELELRKIPDINPRLPGQQLWDPPPREEFRTPKPPQDGTKGTITGVADNLATISVGSDQGAKVGQIFQVYRLGPTPAYLGTLKITNVETHRAAGKFTPATKNATMKKGDTVDSKVIDANDKDAAEEIKRAIEKHEKLSVLWRNTTNCWGIGGAHLPLKSFIREHLAKSKALSPSPLRIWPYYPSEGTKA
ncbi:MAG TPA: hypothetical protein VKS79_14450 [Gemmataceae bacterium]|nr:hypothetical protein [Gemmataceae bacterium]